MYFSQSYPLISYPFFIILKIPYPMKYCSVSRHSSGNSRHKDKVHYDCKNQPQVFLLGGGAKYVHLRTSASLARLLLNNTLSPNKIGPTQRSF